MQPTKACNRKQLAEMYGITERTLYTKLKQIGLNHKGKVLMPCHLALIFEALGEPAPPS
jgi:hypothetical protein